jgi:hypothetical protein
MRVPKILDKLAKMLDILQINVATRRNIYENVVEKCYIQNYFIPLAKKITIISRLDTLEKMLRINVTL